MLLTPHVDQLRRVAAYCRVSTDKEDQVNSLESQKKYFRAYIERNPFWELSEVYVDEGITGTSTKKRHAFNRMMADAQHHAFDLIVTKEISRFARNTLDSILYTRKLKELDIGVIFMNDNINTLDADAELRLTIMSSIAQEESRKTSDRVKWGQKRRMEQGVVFGRDMLGYDVRGGKLHINNEGAEIVRLIFHKFVNEDKGTHVIARELREAGISTATYMKQWSNTAILRVLRNEKYCGDLVQKKTFTPNYLNHEKKYNRGEEEFVVIHDHHVPIIGRELFEKAQIELARRSPCEEQKAKHSNRYCFSGKIKCGVCGCTFVSRSKKRKNGSIYKAWRCYEAAKSGASHVDKAGNQVGCSCMSLNDEDAKLMLQEVAKSLKLDRQKLVENLLAIIQKVVGEDGSNSKGDSIQAKIIQVTEKKQRLLELYLGKDISKKDFQDMNAKYEMEAAVLQKEAEDNNRQTELRENNDALISQIASALKDIAVSGAWDDTFYRHILDKMVVHEDNKVDISLNLFPAKWRFAAGSGGGRHFDTSLPMSFNVACTRLSGMEKRCVR
ncbi:MAG: recombinase family protein [Clostridiaceae bacterium]